MILRVKKWVETFNPKTCRWFQDMFLDKYFIFSFLGNYWCDSVPIFETIFINFRFTWRTTTDMNFVNLRQQYCAILVFLLIITNLPVKSWPICSQSSQSKESCQCNKFRTEQITIKTRNNNINNRNDGCYDIYTPCWTFL